jgi:hypothetical protein
LHRTGFGEPALSPGPLVGSYPTVSPLPAATPEIRDRRSVFCATFRRLSPPLSQERPALWCPDFPRRPNSDDGAEAPRSPGLRPGLYRRLFGRNPPVHAHPALGAPHVRSFVQDELATDRALERRSAQNREELLLERPVERCDPGHTRTTLTVPGTPPRPCRGSERSRRRSARARCSPAGGGRGRSRGRSA